MKIRKGFVSNSSSSSFIVFFPHEIKSREELDKLILTEEDAENIKLHYSYAFTDTKIEERIKKTYQSFLNESRDMGMTYEQFREKAIDYVFQDIQDQKPNDYFQAITTWFGWDYNVDENGVLHTYDDLEFHNIAELREAFKKIDEEVDWSQPDADEQYEELQKYQNLERLKELIDDIDGALNAPDPIEPIISAEPKTYHKEVFYSFSFADEDGTFFSIMEHGGIFGNLKGFRESHH